ncbi:MAG: glycosyltransferase [Clostridia bacterium]|jgi:glycosyltransferase involved in cell wall biosynthesis|nr:glycosyltransferase [Clostridia bacterium]
MVNKRIIFLRSNPVDPDPRVEKEVNSIAKAGYEVVIVAWDRSAKYKLEESYLNLETGMIRIYRFGIPASFGGGIKSNMIPLTLFQIRLFKWLYKNRNNYDIIHACDFDTAFTAFRIARLFKKRFVYDIFDYYVEGFVVPAILKTLIRSEDNKIINSADAVIICTEKRKMQIGETKPRQLLVIHNTPPRINEELKKLDLNKSKIKIAYVGILVYGRFIKELADTIKDNMDYELHIGGFGKYERYFEEMATKYENIIFYGKLPYRRTLELENSCDIMTAIYDPADSNHYYAAPNKFYEALMLGKPLIMVKNTGFDEVVSQNEIGSVIDYNIESLEAGIRNLVRRRSEWPEMSRKMKQLYEKEYSWNRMEERLINLYRVLEAK